MLDILALGEFLIDFTALSNQQYQANPGGAPVNVLIAASFMHRSTGFIGKIGSDYFGDVLADTLKRYGVSTHGLSRCPHIPTTLAFVHLNAQGERSFTFFRNPGADTQLAPQDMDPIYLESCQLFHFGSLSLTHSPAKEATEMALKRVRSAHKLVSYDPNLRPLLWSHLPEEECRRRILWGFYQANVVKVSEEELLWLFPGKSLRQGLSEVHAMGPSLVFLTFGPDGSVASYMGNTVYHPAFSVPVVDTTGAGDAFFGCVLGLLWKDDRPVISFHMNELHTILRYANAAGALCCSRFGAIPAMASADEIHLAQQTLSLKEPTRFTNIDEWLETTGKDLA